MANHDPTCLYIYLHPKEEDDAENEDEENDDEDGHDNMVEDNGPLELMPCDRHTTTDVRSGMIDEMYAAYRRELWYRQ